MRGRVVGLGAAALLGCAQQGSASGDKESLPVVEVDPPPKCREIDEEQPLLVVADGERCPWVLSGQGETLKLEHLGLAAEPPDFSAMGGIPEPCSEGSCEYGLFETRLGPAVLAIEPSAFSEMPQGVQLGWVGEAGLLVFIDLWAGAGIGAMNESTPVGPMFALAPHDCSGELGLLVTPRLDVDASAQPPRTLVAREGIYRSTSSGWEREDVKRTACTPLDIPLP